MNKCKVQKRNNYTYDISFKGLTKGEIFALINIVKNSHSPIANDLKSYLRIGFNNVIPSSEGQELMDYLNAK